MEQATLNSLLVIFIFVMMMAAVGMMVWWRYRPSIRIAPAPIGAGATAGAATTTTTMTNRWSEVPIWVALLLAVILPVLWNMGYFPISESVWFVIISILVVTALAIPNKRTRTMARAILTVLLLVLLSIWFAPFIAKATRWMDRGINHGDWSDTSPQGPAVVSAGRSGSTVAPTTSWSEWRELEEIGLCFRIWTANLDADDVRVRYLNLDGEEWLYDGDYIADAVAISFTSKIGKPVRTYYDTWKKLPGQRCQKT